MGWLDKLNLPDATNQPRRAVPKGVPTPVVKAEKKKTKAAQEHAFRQAVWLRDRSRSRATGKPLARSGVDRDKVGEIHHVLARSTDPDKRLDPSNGILLSRAEHQLAEARCPHDPAHCLLDIDGPTDRARLQVFIWRNVHGKELRRRSS